MKPGKDSYFLLAGGFILFMAFISCQKDLIRLGFPTVETLEHENESIDIGSIRLRAKIYPVGTIPDSVGFVLGTDVNNLIKVFDTTYNTHIDEPFPIEKVIPNLELNQLYYYRVYAEFIDPENIDGVRKVTGDLRSFILGVNLVVPPELPVVNNTVVLVGNVMGLDDDIKVIDHGFVYNIDSTTMPRVGDSKSIPISLGIWDGEEALRNTPLDSLEFNTTYYYRAWMKTASSLYYYSNTGVVKVSDGWKRGFDFPAIFQDGVAVSDGNIAYIIGGCQSFASCQSGTNNNFVFAYDAFSGSWNDQGIMALNFPTHNSIGFILSEVVYFGLGETRNLAPQPLKNFYKLDMQNHKWVSEPIIQNSPALARSRAVSFTIDNKAYFGSGWGKDSLLYDFWEFDPEQGTCHQMQDLPVRIGLNDERWGRRDAIAFSFKEHGYVMCGITVGNLDLNDVWRFTVPDTENPKGKWEFVDLFPGPSRSKGVAFTFEDKAFIALGYNTANNLQELNDLWEYVPDPPTGSSYFQSRVSFLGGKRENAVAFVIGDKAYVGSGQNDLITLGDFWIYTPKKD